MAGNPVAEPGSPADRGPVSRWLSKVDRYASRPLASVLVIGAATVWIIVSVAVGFPARWEIIFQTLVAALTLVMVFVIQHTQARHQRATQRKLDEILLAMPGADNSLLRLERASDEQLREAGHQHRQIRQAALDEGPVPDAGHSAGVDPAQHRSCPGLQRSVRGRQMARPAQAGRDVLASAGAKGVSQRRRYRLGSRPGPRDGYPAFAGGSASKRWV